MSLTVPEPGLKVLVPPDWHRWAIHLLLLADLLFTSRIYRLWNVSATQPAILGLCVLLIAGYTLRAYLQGHFGRVAMVLAGLALIGAQLTAFSLHFGTRLEVNAGFQMIWLLSFIVFFAVCRAGRGKELLDALFFYASAYTVFYVAAASLYQLGWLPGDAAEPLIAEDIERGKRIYCYLIAATFAWFGWLARVRSGPKPGNVVMVLVCATSFALAQSRLLTVLVLAVTALSVAAVRPALIRSVCLTLLWALSIVSLYGLVDADWNPFVFVASDTSGGFRMWEYELARDMLSKHPLAGIGFAPSQWHAWTYLNYDYFSANDLGTIGVWFDWGLAGLVLFFIGSHIASAVPPGAGLEARNRGPLFLTGCVMTAYGCMAPVIFYPAGATYFAVLLGLWLDAYDRPDALHPTESARAAAPGAGDSDW